MAKYLLVESRDPWESSGPEQSRALAATLARGGDTVTYLLVQNGVLPARRCPSSSELSSLAAAGVEVLADDFSLRERGIPADRLAEGVKASPLDVVVDAMAEGQKVIWH